MTVTVEAQVVDPNHLKLKHPTRIPPGSMVLVEITSPPISTKGQKKADLPLRGLAFQYMDPFGSVAEEDWDLLK